MLRIWVRFLATLTKHQILKLWSRRPRKPLLKYRPQGQMIPLHPKVLFQRMERQPWVRYFVQLKTPQKSRTLLKKLKLQSKRRKRLNKLRKKRYAKKAAEEAAALKAAEEAAAAAQAQADLEAELLAASAEEKARIEQELVAAKQAAAEKAAANAAAAAKKAATDDYASKLEAMKNAKTVDEVDGLVAEFCRSMMPQRGRGLIFPPKPRTGGILS